MKEQKKFPEKELNKMEASKLPDTEFKTTVIRMFKELSENFQKMKKDMEAIKMNQPEIMGTLTEMKTKLQGINRRVDEAENKISHLDYMEAENI